MGENRSVYEHGPVDPVTMSNPRTGGFSASVGAGHRHSPANIAWNPWQQPNTAAVGTVNVRYLSRCNCPYSTYNGTVRFCNLEAQKGWKLKRLSISVSPRTNQNHLFSMAAVEYRHIYHQKRIPSILIRYFMLSNSPGPILSHFHFFARIFLGNPG